VGNIKYLRTKWQENATVRTGTAVPGKLRAAACGFIYYYLWQFHLCCCRSCPLPQRCRLGQRASAARCQSRWILNSLPTLACSAHRLCFHPHPPPSIHSKGFHPIIPHLSNTCHHYSAVMAAIRMIWAN
jgi:hypothetical protein